MIRKNKSIKLRNVFLQFQYNNYYFAMSRITFLCLKLRLKVSMNFEVYEKHQPSTT